MSKAEDKAKIAYQFWDISPNNYREYKGFIKGYEQAEIDLEIIPAEEAYNTGFSDGLKERLTWEDVKLIVEIADHLCPYTDKGIAEFQAEFQTEEAYYKEVLKLYNDGKK